MMPTKFRKTLQDFQAYSKEIQIFIGQIEKGSNQLHNYLSVIESAIADPDSPIIPKILSMRFARDIMILGRDDVVAQLVKLVPHLVKICSHRLESSDPNRGQSYFYYHKQYLNATSAQQKKQIQLFGSTYFTLCLQSINRWAKWIPVDNEGNQSRYSQGYNQLLQRGVKFENIFHYYKNADTEKFKNTYKVQFFTQSEYDNNSASSQRLGESLSSKISTTTIFDVNNSEDVRNYLLNMDEKYKKKDRFEKLFKKVTEMFEQTSNSHKLQAHQQQQKQYYEKFLLNYAFLQNKKISAEKFIKIMSSHQLQLEQQQQDLEVPVKEKIKLHSRVQNPKDNKYYEQLFQKQQQSWKHKINFLKQELNDRNKQLKTIRNRNSEDIESVKQQYEERIKLIKKGIIDGSGEKTRYLYQENQALKSKINQLQRKELSQYQESLQNQRERQLEMQNIRLGRQMQQLKIENQKLKNNRKVVKQSPIAITHHENDKQVEEMRVTIKKLEKEAKQYHKKLDELASSIIPKKQKKLNNLAEELKIYKKELGDERETYRKQKQCHQKTITSLQNQLRIAKDKILYLQKKNDLMDLEAAELQEQVKLCKLMDRQTNIMLKNMAVESNEKVFVKKEKIGSSEMSNQSGFKMTNSPNIGSPKNMVPNSPRNSSQKFTFKYKKFQTLRNIVYRRSKQQWYRLVKSTLKNKDILLKEEQLQIGIISNKDSQVSEYEATLFFTNVSDHQIDNLQINAFSQQSLIEQKSNSSIQKKNGDHQFELGTNFIFCLQSHEQEKVSLVFRKKVPIMKIYDPAYLQIHYTKNTKKYKHRLILPYFLFKSVEYAPARNSKYSAPIFSTKQKFEDHEMAIDPNEQQYYAVKFFYSQNILPQPKYIFNYFPGIQKLDTNSDSQIQKYVAIAKVKGYSIQFVVKLQLRSDHVMKVRLLPIRSRANKDADKIDIEQEVYRDYLGFMEFAFKK